MDVLAMQTTFNRYFIYLLSAVVALGGLLFGYDLAIISGTIHAFSRYFQLSETGVGIAVGCINLGAAIGAVLAGKLSDIYGRKNILVICALLFAVTGAGTGWSTTFIGFVTFRTASGVALGMAALVCPIYIAEISPAPVRGRMVSLYQLAITIGVLLAYLANYFLLNTGENDWRWMFSSESAPALLFFICLFFVSESPRWLIMKSRNQEASGILTKIGGSYYATSESALIHSSFETGESVKERFFAGKEIKHLLVLGVLVAIFSQAVGQNAIFSYAPDIFKQAGMTEDSAFLQSSIVGLINLLFTFVAIITIDKLGRKRLLMSGALLLCIDATALSFCFYIHAPVYWMLGFVLGFIAIYAATAGPVTWVILSEMFPNHIRGNAMALAIVSLWIANFFSTASFPVVKFHFGLAVTFFISAVICLFYFFFIMKKIPETKGKSLEDIQAFFKKGTHN